MACECRMRLVLKHCRSTSKSSWRWKDARGQCAQQQASMLAGATLLWKAASQHARVGSVSASASAHGPSC